MGKVIAKKVRAMSLWAKFGLVTVLTLLICTFMYQGWYLPRTAAAAVARVNSVVLNNGTSTTGTITIPATHAGNLLVVVIGGIDQTAGASNVKLGTTAMTKAVGGINTGGPQSIEIWYLANIPAGQTTVTYTYGSAVDNGAVVAEYSGIATTSPLDVTASNVTSGASATLSTGTTANTAAANELWIGAFGDNTTGTFAAPTGGTFYNQTAGNGSQIGLADSTTNSAGPATMGCTGANDWWAGAIAVFKPVASTPTVTSTSPASLPQGATSQTVTITGTNFVAGATVSFNDANITTGAVTVVNATTITVPVTVAAATTTGAKNVSVTTSNGTGTGVFTVNAAPAPTVTSTSPNSGSQGQTNLNVTITGTNFLNGATSSFNDANITVNSTTYVSATQLTANINIAAATAAGAKNVTVTLPGGQTGTGTGVFTVTAPVNSTTAGTATAAQSSGTSIGVSMPYTNDANANNTYTVDYGTSSTGPWTNWATAAVHTSSPYTTTITGLTTGSTYYVRCTYNDADTITGTNPQVIGPITLSVYTDNMLLHNANRFGTCSNSAYSGTSPAACTAAGGTWTPTAKWSGAWGTPGGKYGAFVCSTCHQPHAANIKRVNGSFTTPDGFSIWSSNKVSSVTLNFQNLTSMGHDNRVPNTSSANVCEVCHSRNKYHNYDATRNTLFGGNTTHNNGLDCTGCHPHKVGFKAGESGGNTPCSSCHNDVFGQMNGSTATYHHYMQNADVTPLGSGSKYPNVATLTATDTNRRCLICHVDHDVFRPDLNGANGGARGKNLRTDATVIASTTTGFTRKDFDNSLTNGGICVSCHLNQQTKNTANQKSDGTTVTPVITKAQFAGTMHNYTTNSSAFGDGTRVNVNCVKCHNAQNAEASQKTNFGTHDNTARRLFGALGGTLADPYEEQFCYRCHSKTTDAVGGTVKPAAGKDWYNAVAMSAAAEDSFNAFNGKAYGHKPSSYSGLHKPTSVDETFAYISANKHVECADCHDPHAAKGTSHTAGTNTIAGTSPLTNAAGVATPAWPAAWTAPAQSAYGTAPVTATQEWQICFQCHSGANSNVTTWGGTGAAAWTDLGLEFNPNNRSAHPVAVSLNNQTGSSAPKALTAAQMTAPWTNVGTQTMYCTDCHATDSTGGSKGPHGSSVKWMLVGTGKAWPYNTTAGNGTSTGTLWTLNDAGNTALFCKNCHPLVGTNAAHSNTGDHGAQPCVTCHIRVPHGGKVSRLIATSTAGLPARYKPDGNGGGTVGVTQFMKASSPTGYSTANCNTSCGGHGTVSTPETW